MDDILTTLVDLARLGAVGVGVAIALLFAVLIIRLKSIDQGTAGLLDNFMKWGFGLAVVFALVGLVPMFFQSGGSVPMRIAFSPDFETQGVSAPRIELPDGTPIQAGQKFALESSLTPQVVNVIADKTLAEVRNLREATATLTASVGAITAQRDSLATSIEPAPAVEDRLQHSSAQTERLSTEVARSISRGDYQRANTLSRQLQNVVVAADRPVATIARTTVPARPGG